MNAKIFIVAELSGALIFTDARAADPLPSWNGGKSKQSITAFVEKVTSPGSFSLDNVFECLSKGTIANRYVITGPHLPAHRSFRAKVGYIQVRPISQIINSTGSI